MHALSHQTTKAKQSMPWLLCLVAFFWGGTQIAPGYAFDLGEILNIGDLIFLGIIFVHILARRWGFLNEGLRFAGFICLVSAFACLGIFSLVLNMFQRSIVFSDLLECLRPIYYLVVISYLVRLGSGRRFSWILFAYVFGIMVASTLNMFSTLSELTIGQDREFLLLLNPNVTGNMLAVAVFFCALLVTQGYYFLPILLSAGATILSIFSYSKGAWLMVAMGLLTMAAALYSRRHEADYRNSVVRWLPRLAGVTIAAAGVYFAEPIATIFDAKIAQSVSSETQRSQSTVAMRGGQILSSLQITGTAPLLGVGYSNWQSANAQNEYWLNDLFLENDNPHSAVFYYLSTLGFLGLLLFLVIVLYPLSLPAKLIPGTIWPDRFGRLMFFGFLFISANVMLQIISTPFFWLFTAFMMARAIEQRNAQSREGPAL
jgi:O-Antigen ligase